MNTPKDLRLLSDVFQGAHRTICSLKGNVLVYLIVVILIFGVLGVTIVSLFTTATSSSATPNDARRAYYMAESGIRYALSEIRNNNFNDTFVQSLNNTPWYTLTEGGSFSINVFSPWYEYVSTSGNDLTLDVPNAGEIPTNFSIPNITLVHWNNFNGNPPPVNSYEPITGASATAGNTSLTITITNPASFAVSPGDIVCLAVQPTDADPVSPLQAGEDIYVALDAQDVFPPSNGAIRIVSNDGQLGDYYYQELIPDTSNSRVRLTNLTALPGTPSFTNINDFGTNDWVVLSRQNYRLYATGRSGDVEVVEVEIGNDNPLNIFADAGVWTIYMEELLADREVRESGPLFEADEGVDKKIKIGPDVPPPNNRFGALWYGGEKPIGGDSTFCQEGRCQFGQGIRAFFTLEVTDSGAVGGEGFIFALISAGGATSNNTVNSVGGDVEQSELLGYAGDSRENAGGLPFLDGTLNGDGLKPPKIGLEFDTRTNFDDNFEQTLDYCSDATTLVLDTRNDPDLVPPPPPADEHTVQNVFWGNTTLDIPCRQDDATYDDNKHDAEGPTQKWVFDDATVAVQSSPAIGPDGTIYVVIAGDLYAFDPDPADPSNVTPKWVNSDQTLGSSPAVDQTDGTIYAVGNSDGNVYAFNPDGTAKPSPWPFDTNGDIDASPTVGPDRTVYVGRDYEGIADKGKVFAINPDGTSKGLNWPFEVPTGVENDIDATPAVASDGSVYVGSEDNNFYGINPDGTFKWSFATGYVTAKAAIGSDGTIYVGSNNGNVYAILSDGSSKGLSWPFSTGNNVRSSPAIGVDGTIYVGSDDDNLYAIKPDGTERGNVPTGLDVRSSPAIGSDGTVFVGSDDNNVYAVNQDGTPRWNFLTGLAVRSSPEIDASGTIYVGSDDTNFYAINRYAEPRNFRDDTVKPKKLIISDDFSAIPFATPAEWLKEGPWGVRMEVVRSTTPDTDGNCTYTLNTWAEQCQMADCSDLLSLNFRDTTLVYEVPGRLPKLEQTIEISCAAPDKFERFLFGFTAAASASDTQQAIIRNFELSFSRSGDPVVTAD